MRLGGGYPAEVRRRWQAIESETGNALSSGVANPASSDRRQVPVLACDGDVQIEDRVCKLSSGLVGKIFGALPVR